MPPRPEVKLRVEVVESGVREAGPVAEVGGVMVRGSTCL